jgi:hypothetical protein
MTKFWEEVAQAYADISVNHDRTITIVREGKRAEIAPGNSGAIFIAIFEEEEEYKEPLPAP